MRLSRGYVREMHLEKTKIVRLYRVYISRFFFPDFDFRLSLPSSPRFVSFSPSPSLDVTQIRRGH